MRLSRGFIAGFVLGVWLNLAEAATWQAEWEATVAAAKKEGQVTVYHTRGPFEKVFAEFSKLYPSIKVVSVTGRGGELMSRIMAERRAGKHLTDLYFGSSGSPLDVLYPAKFLEPIAPNLVLPEVKDESKWFQKQHHYADPENKYIFVFEGVVRSDMAYNAKLTDPKEFSSYWDLTAPKWKGKIAAMDPKLPGFPSGLLQFAYYHPDLGPKFLRQLFGETEITLSRDGRQLVDWLAVGKFAIALATSASDVEAAMKQGLPVGRFEPKAFKEGIYMRATQGSLSILARPPHPHAAKLLANWLLSREGQIHYQKYFLRIDPVFSLREDVPVDPAVAPYRPKPGDKFMPVYRPEFRDLDAAFRVIDEALKR
ncbi:MAG TPA: extracellular solute-binding protein [Candidatus Acidoferrales bacterium]|nr:extracellular solute-binding protein [Candidatus Acidoferrales bacterium]